MTHNLYLGRQEWLNPVPADCPITYNEVATRALITHEDKVLLVYEAHLDSWWMPGGRIKPGEDMISGLLREIEEETALETKLGDLNCLFDVVVHESSKNANKHMFHFVFHASPVKAPDFIERDHFDTDPDHPGKVSKVRWFTMDEVRALPRVFPAFLHNWSELIKDHPKAYYGTKTEDNPPPGGFTMDKFRVSTRAIATKNKKLLMVTADSWGFYCAPGGMVEFGEDVMTTAAREVHEEAGITARAVEVIAVDEFFSHQHQTHGINLYVRCAVDSDTAPTEWRDIDGGKVVKPTFLTQQQLAALTCAYPLYMAELAWPNSMKESA